MPPIYLDHNASTPIDPEVLKVMLPYLEGDYGNPSSVTHKYGHRASLAVDLGREQVAMAINARPNEIIFTSGCTEANNIAILGFAKAELQPGHMITCRVEHPAVLAPMRELERLGWRITYLPVDSFGQVSTRSVEEAIADDTRLVSIMAANNEVGTLQPISEIGAICARRNIYFHTDAAQLPAYGVLDVERDNVHMVSLSAHKAYGPKGVGALYIRLRKPRVRLAPILFGGGQERGLRPGTLNPAGIAGMGKAFDLARQTAGKEAKRLSSLSAQMRDRFLQEIPEIQLNGHVDNRLANNLSFSVPGIEPLALIHRLREKVSFSASSACATDKIETSHVLKAMFGDTPRAQGAFRIASGRQTTSAQMQFAADAIVDEVRRLKGLPKL